MCMLVDLLFLLKSLHLSHYEALPKMLEFTFSFGIEGKVFHWPGPPGKINKWALFCEGIAQFGMKKKKKQNRKESEVRINKQGRTNSSPNCSVLSLPDLAPWESAASIVSSLCRENSLFWKQAKGTVCKEELLFSIGFFSPKKPLYLSNLCWDDGKYRFILPQSPCLPFCILTLEILFFFPDHILERVPWNRVYLSRLTFI